MSAEEFIQNNPNWPAMQATIIARLSQGETPQSIVASMETSGVGKDFATEIVAEAIIQKNIAISADGPEWEKLQQTIIRDGDAGNSPSETVATMVRAGFDEDAARRLVIKALSSKPPKPAYRLERIHRYFRHMLIGGGLCVMALAITAVAYTVWGARDDFWILWGFVAVSGVYFLYGLLGWRSNR